VNDNTKAIKRTGRLLHYVTGSEQRGMLSFCCEGQPLATIRSFGIPTRCPICQQVNPLPGERTSLLEHRNQVRGTK
jgi:hypothetical protein